MVSKSALIFTHRRQLAQSLDVKDRGQSPSSNMIKDT